ncbi:MAG: hypothetical protein LBP68_02220 [Acidobacteriota bacterium]|nr:hypothetical protein [Acidobacteriota bacterium]
MDNIKYCNELLSRVETLMYQELSGMAYWKCEFVGTDFIRTQQIEGTTVDEIVESCKKAIVAAGLVTDIESKTDGSLLLKLKVRNCIHHEKEKLVKAEGVAPYICPIANMVLDQIHQKLKYQTSYLTKIAMNEKEGWCLLYMALYKTHDDIGKIADWLKDDPDAEWLKAQPSQILASEDRKKK